MGWGGRGDDDAHDAHGGGEVSHQHFRPQLRASEFCLRDEASVTAPGKCSRKPKSYVDRTDDLYDLYQLYDIFPLHDLDIPGKIDLDL